MGIPKPNAGGAGSDFVSVCDMYDGNAQTSGYCNGWMSRNNQCTRRSDELGQNCDGCGKFPPDIEAKYK